MGKEIKDKVQLEKIINEYLLNDIPLSILTENIDLTYPQMQLLINRTIGFSRQADKLIEENPELSYDDLSEDLLNIPHIMKEEYPKKHEEIMGLFAAAQELKNKIDICSTDELNYSLEKEEQLKNKLANYDMNIISKIEHILPMLDQVTDSEDIANLLLSNGILIKDLTPLNEMYDKYLKDKNDLLELQTKIEVLKQKEQRNKITRRKLEQEYEHIRETIIVSNVKLVNWIIRKFFNNIPLPKEDTQAFGLEGLVIAINEFDYTKGFHFSTFATTVIVHHIEHHFKDLYGMSWENFINKESIKYYRKLMQSAKEGNNRITPQELADLGLISLSAKQIKNYDEMLDGIVPMSTIYEPLESEYPETRRYELPETFEDYETIDEYEDKTGIDAEIDIVEAAINGTLKEKIRDVLRTLTPREEEVLKYRFGIDGYPELSLEETGLRYNVSKERIRQIEAKALRKLRHPIRSRELMSYYRDDYNPASHRIVRLNPKVIFFNKIISLLKSNVEPSTMLNFMAMEKPMSMEELVSYIEYIYNICKISKSDKAKQKELSSSDIHRLARPQYFNDQLPIESYNILLSSIDQVEKGIEHFINVYNQSITTKENNIKL